MKIEGQPNSAERRLITDAIGMVGNLSPSLKLTSGWLTEPHRICRARGSQTASVNPEILGDLNR